MAVEPVRRLRLLLRGRPRGDDAQVAIDLHGIGVDDDAAEPLRPASSASADLPLAVGPAISTGQPIAIPSLHEVLRMTPRRNPDLRSRNAVARRGGARARARGAAAAPAPPIGSTRASPPTSPLARTAPPTNAPHLDALTNTLADAIRATLGGLPADVVVQPLAHRRKRLLLADMDSTMIGQECIDELADHAGIKAHVAAITERAMRGEIDFEPALRERVALLKGLPATVVDEVIARPHHADARRTGAGRRPCARPAPTPASCRAASRLSPSRIAAMIGFDENRANTLVVAGRSLCRHGRRSRSWAAPPSSTRCARLRQRLGLDPRGNARGRRRRQRHSDAAGGRPRRRLPRQAEDRRGRRAPASTTAT